MKIRKNMEKPMVIGNLIIGICMMVITILMIFNNIEIQG